MATTEQSQQGHERSTDKQEYPFSAVLSDNGRETIDMVFRHIDGTIEEIRLNMDSSGWSFTAVDPSNVGMVDVSIPTDVFTEYDSREDTTVAINCSALNDAIQDTDGNTHITVRESRESDEYDCDRVIDVSGTVVPGFGVENVRRPPDVPDLGLTTVGTLTNMELLKHFIVHAPSDHIQITGSDSGLTLHCESDMNSARLELPDGNGYDVSDTTGQELKRVSLTESVKDFHAPYRQDGHADSTVFSQDYLENFFGKLLKAQRDCEYELHMGTEFPIQLIRNDDSPVEYMYMLAPRIQST